MQDHSESQENDVDDGWVQAKCNAAVRRLTVAGFGKAKIKFVLLLTYALMFGFQPMVLQDGPLMRWLDYLACASGLLGCFLIMPFFDRKDYASGVSFSRFDIAFAKIGRYLKTLCWIFLGFALLMLLVMPLTSLDLRGLLRELYHGLKLALFLCFTYVVSSPAVFPPTLPAARTVSH